MNRKVGLFEKFAVLLLNDLVNLMMDRGFWSRKEVRTWIYGFKEVWESD